MNFHSIFCKHDWCILSEEYTKSDLQHFIEELDKKGMKLTNIKNVDTSRAFVQIVSCKKCGKIKQFITYT